MVTLTNEYTGLNSGPRIDLRPLFPVVVIETGVPWRMNGASNTFKDVNLNQKCSNHTIMGIFVIYKII